MYIIISAGSILTVLYFMSFRTGRGGKNQGEKRQLAPQLKKASLKRDAGPCSLPRQKSLDKVDEHKP